MNQHDDPVMVSKTAVMIEMQDQMNSRVDADWRQRGREWYRAIWIECAELMDHYGGWKWWKHSTPDIDQVILEIVDIWHFGLSLRMNDATDTEAVASAMVNDWHGAESDAAFLEVTERLAITALSDHEFDVSAVAQLLSLCDRGFDDLYRAYVAKNVLNMFRQNNGYKSGEYIKTWDKQEDNEVLASLLNDLDSDSATFREDVYNALEERYAMIKEQQQK